MKAYSKKELLKMQFCFHQKALVIIDHMFLLSNWSHLKLTLVLKGLVYVWFILTLVPMGKSGVIINALHFYLTLSFIFFLMIPPIPVLCVGWVCWTSVYLSHSFEMDRYFKQEYNIKHQPCPLEFFCSLIQILKLSFLWKYLFPW